MHTNPCANMETHWPVHLKRDPRPTHFEREAGPYALSVRRPIRSEMRRPRFAGTLRACKCTLSAGRSEREYMTESCPTAPFRIESNTWFISRIIVRQATNDREIWFLDNGKGSVFMILVDE